MTCIRVSAPAHLHIGNFELTCDLGRCFGTVGVAVEEPRLVLRVCRAPDVMAYTISGDRWCKELESYAREYAEVVAEKLGVGLRVELIRCYPWGAGLGARTNLALSIGVAAHKLAGEEVRVEDVAMMLGRARVSGLGLYAFMHGGLVVDGGFDTSVAGFEPPPLVYRWASDRLGVAIVTPLNPLGQVRRVKESVESQGSYPRAPESLSGLLTRIVFNALGYLASGDARRAFTLLSRLNTLVGDYWAGLGQGGRFCCSEAEALIKLLGERGALGVFQSSWGPTVWGVFESLGKARAAVDAALRERGRLGELLAWATRIDVRGAKLVVEEG